MFQMRKNKLQVNSLSDTRLEKLSDEILSVPFDLIELFFFIRSIHCRDIFRILFLLIFQRRQQ